MRYSDMKKEPKSHLGVVCSGKRKCKSCKEDIKKYKSENKRNIRRQNKDIVREAEGEV